MLIDNELVTQAQLKFIHRDHKVSTLKLSMEEKNIVFRMWDDSMIGMVYKNLVDPNVKLPLQHCQQHFHLMKPLKYTLPDQHMDYVFSLACSHIGKLV